MYIVFVFALDTQSNDKTVLHVGNWACFTSHLSIVSFFFQLLSLQMVQGESHLITDKFVGSNGELEE